MARLLTTLLVPVCLVLPAVAVAQPSAPADPSAMAANDCARMTKSGKPCKIFDMGQGEDLTGEGVKPDDLGITVREITSFNSLIRVRKDFIVEILKSAEDLD